MPSTTPGQAIKCSPGHVIADHITSANHILGVCGQPSVCPKLIAVVRMVRLAVGDHGALNLPHIIQHCSIKRSKDFSLSFELSGWPGWPRYPPSDPTSHSNGPSNDQSPAPGQKQRYVDRSITSQNGALSVSSPVSAWLASLTISDAMAQSPCQSEGGFVDSVHYVHQGFERNLEVHFPYICFSKTLLELKHRPSSAPFDLRPFRTHRGQQTVILINRMEFQ